MPRDLKDAWYDDEVSIVCQKSMFDRTIMSKRLGRYTNYQPRLERWEDKRHTAIRTDFAGKSGQGPSLPP